LSEVVLSAPSGSDELSERVSEALERDARRYTPDFERE